MLFKTELTEVFTMAEMDKIVKALRAKGIDAATKNGRSDERRTV